MPPYPPLAIASSSNLLLISSGPSLIIYEPSTHQTTVYTPDTKSPSLIRHSAISSDGTVAATISDDKSLLVYSISTNSITLRSSRQVMKKSSSLSFSPKGDLIISDKVGDVYLYPLDPRSTSSINIDPPDTSMTLNSDPTLNPDADFLLGHVSILTSHVLSMDGKHIITSDRDEHIRISRYPQSFVIERFLFGSESFVSALCIPPRRPEILLSAGGEGVMRVWGWETGRLIGNIELYEGILPCRKVRAGMRRDARASKRMKMSSSTNKDVEKEEEFYVAPEGWRLPSGQGVCIKKIQVIQIESQDVVVFFSEGCAGLHSFVLAQDLTHATVNTFKTDFPVLDFTQIPGEEGRLVVSVDTAWGSLKRNRLPDEKVGPVGEVDEEMLQILGKVLMVVEVSSGGQISALPNHPILTILSSALSGLSPADPKTLASLDLYPDLSLYPRWPGMEEDDDQAGQTDSAVSEAGESVVSMKGKLPNEWTREELEKLNVKQLGRLKAQGVDTGDLIYKKKKALKSLGTRAEQLKRGL
ncbi:hypothetical protein TREMEDRAFT_69302 [Tremella mesenterica DSM 1558]|uniref:uncharacterized protein n=1 Tax=Tremella mesenterica (strain ATCC 24925 / CBS 8224 / DSM 1558 / NBRC 9311 / NRRL Y-6157 / RJB 2259-6 / UBC 559-6) TaxID=578456 RepID=UPI0003F4A630|nr:uncharacterized protein TREMEDRAFT_69302 [Tremella mesenterica DSM 1558]EIW68303.1 hypothetical protein TREMEDRAFT_69302 [Tremella mesenterica DSM 1558]